MVQLQSIFSLLLSGYPAKVKVMKEDVTIDIYMGTEPLQVTWMVFFYYLARVLLSRTRATLYCACDIGRRAREIVIKKCSR